VNKRDPDVDAAQQNNGQEAAFGLIVLRRNPSLLLHMSRQALDARPERIALFTEY
jgi:hypothetical protein